MWILLALLGLAVLVVGAWYAFIRSVETPSYEVVRSEGPFELRDYPPLVAAEVAERGSRQTAVQSGFGPLARYIFAKERPGEKIAMTAPVTQTPTAGASTGEGTWQVRFIMPSKYTKASLPLPGAGGVRLVELPARRMAAIRFSGRADDADFEARSVQLRSWIEEQGLTPSGPPTLAYYDDPFVPGFLRRNEVLVPVEGGDE